MIFSSSQAEFFKKFDRVVRFLSSRFALSLEPIVETTEACWHRQKAITIWIAWINWTFFGMSSIRHGREFYLPS